ncbi:hypothetical protein PV327_006586 [Microctonus hyperodae]|uniref:G-patch domain-containing protein n=1 Tax=Microctonus hyperodae TaxID=165561 RepID=A0AA39F4M5_MICHY|nr:hypothetical protein PV327_006586 [Microctonus hyperodae]
MAQESKKISFGFSKSIKKPDLKPVIQIETKKVDYIEYVDEKSMKVVPKDEKTETPLIIPMLGSTGWHERIVNKINADIYGASNEDVHKKGNAKLTDVTKKLSNNSDKIHSIANGSVMIEQTSKENQEQTKDVTVSLEELAAQELLQDLQNDKKKDPSVDISIEQSNNFDGAEMSTLENYEEIPIEKFGKGLLLGMGWVPERGIGKTPKIVEPNIMKDLRPKRMGLGINEAMLQKQIRQPKTKEEQELKLERGCYVRVTGGKYSNNYGQVESFDDDDPGRLIVKLALENKYVSLMEYLIEPVTKDNYTHNSKVLNISTYENFKNKLDSKLTHKSSDLNEASKKEKRNVRNEQSNRERSSNYRDKSSTSAELSDSDDKHKRKYELNKKDNHRKSKKVKKHHRHHDESELSRKINKREKSEKTRSRSKVHNLDCKSSDRKKHKKHKRSRSKSFDR